MRAQYDWLTGMNFTRLLSIRYGNIVNRAAEKRQAVHVGRVMSCVLGMVVERERAITNHQQETFYKVIATMGEAKGEFRGEVDGLFRDTKNSFATKEAAQKIADDSPIGKFMLTDIKVKQVKKNAPPLFNLAELQADCSKNMKISPEQTLEIAQSLYEKKLTTYPRTDARVLSSAVAKVIRTNIEGLRDFNPDIIDEILAGRPEKIENTKYTDDSKISDHYAIIPTGDTSAFESLNAIEKRVYEAVVLRFLAIFLPPCITNKVEVVLTSNWHNYHFSAEQVHDPGYNDLYGKGIEKNPAFLSLIRLKDGDKPVVSSVEVVEGKTNPPSRYTSGKLILAMENAGKLIEDEDLREEIKDCGVGTSATRAAIIQKLLDIKYLSLNKKTQVITPTNLGQAVYEVLYLTLPSFLKPNITANWEKGLNQVADGKITVDKFRGLMIQNINSETQKVKSSDISEELARRIKPYEVAGAGGEKKETEIICPLCKRGHLSFIPGKGYGCTEYKNEEHPCNFFIGAFMGKILDEDVVKELCETGQTKEPVTGLVYVDKFTKQRRTFSSILLLKPAKHYKTGEDTLEVGFPEREKKPVTSFDHECPMCHERSLVKNSAFVKCTSCGFSMFHTLSGRVFDDEFLGRLLDEVAESGETEEITGLTSKAGKPYSTKLVLNKRKREMEFPKFKKSGKKKT